MSQVFAKTLDVDSASMQVDFIDRQEELPSVVLGNEHADSVSSATRRKAKLIELFGGSWSCESEFTAVNYNKDFTRGRLTNKWLGELLRIGISLAPGISATCRTIGNTTYHISLFLAACWAVANEQLTRKYFLISFVRA